MRRIRLPKVMRRHVTNRAAGCCEYCQSQEAFATQSFSVDHIIPVDLDGPTTLDNLAHACQGCNSHKLNRVDGVDPATGRRERLFHPRIDRWDDHFSWSEDYSHVIGLTTIGRATVSTLMLNRPGLLNLRRVLRAVGQHPSRRRV